MKIQRISINSITQFSIKLFIFLIVFLPSGTIGGLNIKMLSMAILVASMMMSILVIRKVNRATLLLISTSCASIIFVIFNYMNATNISLSRGYANAEGMLFITYFLSTAILLIAIAERIISKNSVIKTILFSCAFYSLIKILITFLSVIGVVSIYAISDFIYQTYSIKPMLFPITDTLSRFQLANDYIVCFALYFIISRGGDFTFISSRAKNILTYILMLSVLISFSRYMILLLIIGLAIKLCGVRKISIKGFLAVFFVISLSTIGYLSNMESINDAVSLRFSSDANDVSDETRSVQVECLTKAFDNKPFFGNGGLGDFSSKCPGPRGAEFSYEVQYLGFLYRFGIVQTLFIAILYFSQFKISMAGGLSRIENSPSLIAFVCWMMIGFFNPYLVSGYASVIMVLCICFTKDREYKEII